MKRLFLVLIIMGMLIAGCDSSSDETSDLPTPPDTVTPDIPIPSDTVTPEPTQTETAQSLVNRYFIAEKNYDLNGLAKRLDEIGDATLLIEVIELITPLLYDEQQPEFAYYAVKVLVKAKMLIGLLNNTDMLILAKEQIEASNQAGKDLLIGYIGEAVGEVTPQPESQEPVQLTPEQEEILENNRELANDLAIAKYLPDNYTT